MFEVLDEVCVPQRSTKYSAYVDLFAREDVIIGAGETKIIPLGIKIDLKYLKEELKQLGCIYSNSVANFLVVKLGIKNEEKFEEEISQKGILIRRNFTQEFLKGYRRIGISTVENINQLIEIVRKYK